MNPTRLDLYTDYLTVIFGYATATGLSQLLNGAISHETEVPVRAAILNCFTYLGMPESVRIGEVASAT